MYLKIKISTYGSFDWAMDMMTAGNMVKFGDHLYKIEGDEIRSTKRLPNDRHGHSNVWSRASIGPKMFMGNKWEEV